MSCKYLSKFQNQYQCKFIARYLNFVDSSHLNWLISFYLLDSFVSPFPFFSI